MVDTFDKDRVLESALSQLDELLTKWVDNFDFAADLMGLSVEDLDEQCEVLVNNPPAGYKGTELYQRSLSLDSELRDFVQDILLGAANAVNPKGNY